MRDTYKCRECGHKWKTRKKVGEPASCPNPDCRSTNIFNLSEKKRRKQRKRREKKRKKKRELKEKVKKGWKEKVGESYPSELFSLTSLGSIKKNLKLVKENSASELIKLKEKKRKQKKEIREEARRKSKSTSTINLLGGAFIFWVITVISLYTTEILYFFLYFIWFFLVFGMVFKYHQDGLLIAFFSIINLSLFPFPLYALYIFWREDAYPT